MVLSDGAAAPPEMLDFRVESATVASIAFDTKPFGMSSALSARNAGVVFGPDVGPA